MKNNESLEAMITSILVEILELDPNLFAKSYNNPLISNADYRVNLTMLINRANVSEIEVKSLKLHTNSTLI